MRATRNDSGSGLSGALTRGEFMEAIVRMVHSGAKDRQHAVNFQNFMDRILVPMASRSQVNSVRTIIRRS